MTFVLDNSFAMRHGLPLATQDQQLKKAALAAGVEVL
jgi:rRNA-processing protein FCF1